MDDLVEIVAMGLCAKHAIGNGGSGHGRWWELGDEAKEVFRGYAIALLSHNGLQPLPHVLHPISAAPGASSRAQQPPEQSPSGPPPPPGGNPCA